MAILETERLSKNFGGLKALQDITFSVDRGEIFGVIGPNGSGKTTLINVITGFLKPKAGSIMYKGASIKGLRPDEIAEGGIIRTFQLASVFPNLTVEENVIAGRHLKVASTVFGSLSYSKSYREAETKLRQKATEILALMEMQERRNVLAKNLSLGEQKKLEVAIALAAGPELLLLDEPASGMNPEEAARQVQLMQRLQQMGITLLIVEHNMRVMMGLCTRIIVLNYGVKIAEGTPEEISENDKVISVYLGEGRQNAAR